MTLPDINTAMSVQPTSKLSSWVDRLTSSQAFYIIFKLPTLLATVIIGFILEFLMELPFMAICIIDSRLRKRKSDGEDKCQTR